MRTKILLFALLLVSFGCKTTYESTVTGLENNAAVKVVKSNKSLQSYVGPYILLIDGNEFEISKIYSEKKSLKAQIFPTTPGKHEIEVRKDRNSPAIYKKSVLIDHRETRVVVLE